MRNTLPSMRGLSPGLPQADSRIFQIPTTLSYKRKPQLWYFHYQVIDEASTSTCAIFDATLGMNGDNPELTLFRRTLKNFNSYRGGVAGFLYCQDGAECLNDVNPKISTGDIYGDLTELDVTYPLNTTRTLTFSSAYEYFFQTTPKYMAFGATNLEHVGNLSNFNLTATYTKNVIRSTLTVQPYEEVKFLSAQCLVSDWGKFYLYSIWNFLEGLQAKYIDFTTENPNFENSFKLSSADASLEYRITHDPSSLLLAGNKGAIVMFTGYQILAGVPSVTVEYEHVPSLDDNNSVVIRITKKSPTQLKGLRGYVVIFTKSNSNPKCFCSN